MACNLNFNQCNSFLQYPTPVFNCLRNFIANLNKSENIVINPIIDSSFALSSINNQNIGNNSIVQSTIAFNRGNRITFSNASFILSEGNYLISYLINGLIATNNNFAFALFENENLISSSISSSSGINGNTANASNSKILSVKGTPVVVTLKNISGTSINVMNGNITIQKI